MLRCLMGVWSLMLIGSLPAGAADNGLPWTEWPPRPYLLQALNAAVEPILESQDPATGRFGTQPWICTDQNVLLTLAVAWSLNDPANEWYHSDRLLQAIARGGEALVDDQDEKGMWIFRKKDNSTWGQIHMPWIYSRWIRAYELVREALPAESRARWDAGLRLGFTGIRAYMDGSVHNIGCHHAMGLYVAGKMFENLEWQDAARAYMARVVTEQDPAGFWSEHKGPVVGYNQVYLEALGVYYSYSQDPVALEALRRGALFHASILWPDGSSVACIDERQIYHAGRDLGTVGSSWTPEGRGFLIQQVGEGAAANKPVGGEYAAQMLLHGGQGPGIAPAGAGDHGSSVLGDNGAHMRRDKPWMWALSAYTAEVPDSRWIQDRQNHLDVYRDGLGLVIGGGNTKLQPYWSTFTVGDPELLKHQPGDESPDFRPQIPLQWTADSSDLDVTDGTLPLGYGALTAAIGAETDGESLVLIYRAPAGQGVEAHVPLMKRGDTITTAGGAAIELGEAPIALTAAAVGEYFVHAGLKVSMPAEGRLLWPARQHNPYTKDGSSSLRDAKLVLALPFGEGIGEYRVRLDMAPLPE